ncbi:MAG: UDP-N-acetylmuramate dehydrogenase [Phocaeicola sp.]|nr:UDP-N-acetylmuramate dehydrogenase [Phocaeicola sp.]
MKEYINHSLLPYNTFGMDVKANRFVEYETLQELQSLLSDKNRFGSPYLHIGGGSNLLFTGDYSGLVLHSSIKGFSIENETEEWVEIKAGAGEVWDDFVAFTVENGWYGAENLSLIPGEVGASAVQNIGAYGVEAKDIISKVYAVSVDDASLRIFTNDECMYSYRESIFKHQFKGKYIIAYVIYRLKKQREFHLEYGNILSELEKKSISPSDLTLNDVRNVIIEIRRSKLPDPQVLGNAGSFFMNPIVSVEKYNSLSSVYPDMPHYKVGENTVKIPAGWMIDRCGWKGKSVGNAGVHDKQALVIVNRGGATGDEIVNLARLIVKSVEDKFGIIISPEVNFI